MIGKTFDDYIREAHQISVDFYESHKNDPSYSFSHGNVDTPKESALIRRWSNIENIAEDLAS